MSSSVKDAIKRANSKFSDHIRNGDHSGLSSLYTEDVVLLPPNSTKVSGRDRSSNYWGGVMKNAGLKDAALNTDEVSGSGDQYTEMGSYTLKMQKSGKSHEDHGKYVAVWKKTSDGWKNHRHIWNSNKPSSQ